MAAEPATKPEKDMKSEGDESAPAKAKRDADVAAASKAAHRASRAVHLFCRSATSLARSVCSPSLIPLSMAYWDVVT